MTSDKPDWQRMLDEGRPFTGLIVMLALTLVGVVMSGTWGWAFCGALVVGSLLLGINIALGGGIFDTSWSGLRRVHEFVRSVQADRRP